VSATVVERIESPVSMPAWPAYPMVYEINTWVWLTDLSQQYGRNVDLSSVPPVEWDAIAAYGFDSVWLMGVWERSPTGMAIASQNKSLLDEFRRVLPDFSTEDNVGSPYCVRRYVVDEHLGGSEGLAVARKELSRRGMQLILDFVPTSHRIIRGSLSTRSTSFEALPRTPRMIPLPTSRSVERFVPTDVTPTFQPGRTSCS
jgi:hypothetical protein